MAYKMGKWPMPNNQYAQEHFHCEFIWNQCANATCLGGLARNLLIGIKRVGYDDQRIARYVFEHQPVYRACKVCGAKIVNFLNYKYCPEHLHLSAHGKSRNELARRNILIEAIRSRTGRKDGTLAS